LKNLNSFENLRAKHGSVLGITNENAIRGAPIDDVESSVAP
jgi:hypothetical protein